MINQEDQEKLANEVAKGLREWMKQHPEATFAEIEQELWKFISQVQAEVVKEIMKRIEAAQNEGMELKKLMEDEEGNAESGK